MWLWWWQPLVRVYIFVWFVQKQNHNVSLSVFVSMNNTFGSFSPNNVELKQQTKSANNTHMVCVRVWAAFGWVFVCSVHRVYMAVVAVPYLIFCLYVLCISTEYGLYIYLLIIAFALQIFKWMPIHEWPFIPKYSFVQWRKKKPKFEYFWLFVLWKPKEPQTKMFF